jgi:hypothetical protein
MNPNSQSTYPTVAPTGRASVRAYEAGLVRLQDLEAAGRANSDEAERVRDDMDGPWAAMSRPERDLMDGLSADLFMLSGDERREAAGSLDWDSVSSDRLRGQLYNDGQWVEFLRVLRRGPTGLAEWFIARVRAEAYVELGLQRAAARFWDHADRLRRRDQWKAWAIIFSRRTGDLPFAFARAEEAVGLGDADPHLLVVAAATMFTSRADVAAADLNPLCRRVISAFDRALTAPTLDDRLRAVALACKGFAAAMLGDEPTAAAAFSVIFAELPFDPITSVARLWLADRTVPAQLLTDAIVRGLDHVGGSAAAA